MSTIILITAASSLTAWIGFLCVAKGSTIVRVSLANAGIACLSSLYLLSEPAPVSEISPLLAIGAAALVTIGLMAHWLLHALPDTAQDESRGS